MIFSRSSETAFFILCSLVTATAVLAAGGTSIVATEGQAVPVLESWPVGVGELVNDAMRTMGWNSWFTEWPNDVHQYAFDAKSTDEVNRLIEKLAAIKSDIRQIRLSYLKEPNSLGWVTRLPEGNNIPLIFSIGDQTRIDKWYKTVRKPFGAMNFTATPVAVPPTITIFVQNESVNLDKLKIPEGIEVEAGYVPTVFHRSNTTFEQARGKDAARKENANAWRAQLGENLDPESQSAANAIQAFLRNRKTVNGQ